MVIYKNNKFIFYYSSLSLITLLSYQFFSIAYFFFREKKIGLFQWIILGVSIGAIELYKKIKLKDEII